MERGHKKWHTLINTAECLGVPKSAPTAPSIKLKSFRAFALAARPFVGKGRKYNLQMTNTPLKDLKQYDCVVIVTDHSDYDYRGIVEQAQLVVDTRNATRGIVSPKIVHC